MRFLGIILPFLFLFLTSCKEENRIQEGYFDIEGFIPKYNAYIDAWLDKQLSNVAKKIAEKSSALEKATTEIERDAIQSSLDDLEREQERYNYRKSLGGYFLFKKPSDIPEGLVWKNGMEQEEIGDPRSKKGGVFRTYIREFPATLRQFGQNSNTSFRGDLYDNLDVPLVNLHPKTMRVIPGVANEWAEGPDGRTMFYKLRKDVTYSTGEPVKAIDFMTYIYVRVSDFVTNPYQKQYFREQMANVTVYDDYTLSVSLPEKKPLLPYYTALSCSSSQFYKEYGPDFVERYNWRVEPTTGAYYVASDGVVKGVSVELTRKKNWWGDDKKFYQYRYNAGKIRYTVVRDRSKAFELFRAGEIDYFGLTQPEYWYEKSEIPPVFDGYIERYTFYNRYPRPTYGVYMNLTTPLMRDRNVRWGVQYSLNWQKVIDVMFRGDYERLNGYIAGYGEFDHPKLRSPEYSVAKAREWFSKAGYMEQGEDGILRNKKGEMLEMSVTYTSLPAHDRIMAILKEEARRCGLNLILDGLEPTTSFKKILSKKHQSAFMAWGASPPFPRLYGGFFSKNAYDEKGQPKPQTNNINTFSDPEMDKAALALRFARSIEDLKKAAWRGEEIIHDQAIISHGFQSPFLRIGCWRWMRWPDTEETRFCPPVVELPLTSYVWWIDDEMKEETLEAKRVGKTFPEVQEIKDAYWDKKGGVDE